MLSLQEIKKSREILSPEIIKNMDMQDTKEFGIEYSLLCKAAGSLDVLIQKLEKRKKRDEKIQNAKNF